MDYIRQKQGKTTSVCSVTIWITDGQYIITVLKIAGQTRCGPALQNAPEAKRRCKKKAKQLRIRSKMFYFAKGNKVVWGSIELIRIDLKK